MWLGGRGCEGEKHRTNARGCTISMAPNCFVKAGPSGFLCNLLCERMTSTPIRKNLDELTPGPLGSLLDRLHEDRLIEGLGGGELGQGLFACLKRGSSEQCFSEHGPVLAI